MSDEQKARSEIPMKPFEHTFGVAGMPVSNCTRCGIYYKEQQIMDCLSYLRWRKLDRLLRATRTVADVVLRVPRASCNDMMLVRTDDLFRLRELLDDYTKLVGDDVSKAEDV